MESGHVRGRMQGAQLHEKRLRGNLLPGVNKNAKPGRPRSVDHDRVRAEWADLNRWDWERVGPDPDPAEFARRHNLSERQLRRILASIQDETR